MMAAAAPHKARVDAAHAAAVARAEKAARAARAAKAAAARAEKAAGERAAERERIAAANRAARVRAAAEAKARAASGWTLPVAGGYSLGSSFGQGGSLWSHGHTGEDFVVPSGTTVRAAAKGVVVKAGANGGGDGAAYGNAIVVKHADGRYTQYAHLSSVGVSVGQSVGKGEAIGVSGATGNTTGPHLHFEVRTTADYGSAVDPVAFLRSRGVSV
ncbi:peptidase [Mangrovactinospora gilvigrisea]|uniref:Peptidase n=2 Tax=Mangrovactinospora gilvigrisea TaxID=1428644 RepID=A0A1J7C724_9ACTN|nr:peptidase [Mangrovactinospora gilvigrisea]